MITAGRGEQRLEVVLSADCSRWHFAADLRRAARLRTGLLYRLLHEWQQAGRLETQFVFDGDEHRRGYRLTDSRGR